MAVEKVTRSSESTPGSRLRQRLSAWGIRGGAYFGLAALLLMLVGVVYPKPLYVIASMSLAHVLGALAALSYLAAVLSDLSGKPPEP